MAEVDDADEGGQNGLDSLYPEDLPKAASLADLPRQERNEIVLALLAQKRFDFLDFGTHKGGGLRIGNSLGGQAGLGVELDDAKVVALFRRGAFAYSGNVLELPQGLKARFAVCSHVLEHLPSRYEVGTIINQLQRSCSDYIFITQPSFDVDSALFERGLRMAHSPMKNHDCRLTTRELVDICWDLGLERFVVGGAKPISDTSHSWIHSTQGRKNVWKWKPGDAPKPDVRFGRPLHRDIVAVIGLKPGLDLAGIATAGGMKTLYLESRRMEFCTEIPWPSDAVAKLRPDS